MAITAGLVKPYKTQEKMDGYVALVSVMVLVAIAGIFLSFSALNRINFIEATAVKRENIIAHATANSCAELAISELQQDLTYSAGDVFTVGPNTCAVTVVGGAGNNDRTIEARSQVGRAQVTVRIEIDTVQPNVIIDTWNRI